MSVQTANGQQWYNLNQKGKLIRVVTIYFKSTSYTSILFYLKNKELLLKK